MSERTSATILLQDARGQSYVGQTDSDDIEQLTELLGEEPRSVSLDESADTQGHALADQVILDVEGHAVALRLPTAADAAAVRRAFAAGVVTASLVIGGAAAAVAGADALANAQQAQAPAPAADAEQPADGGSPLHLPRPIERE